MLEMIVDMEVLKYSCISCLRPAPLKISNLGQNLKDEYFNITNIKVFNVKNLPMQLCCYCKVTLKRIIRFKEQCLKSFKVLTESHCKTSTEPKLFNNQIYAQSPTFSLHIDPEESVKCEDGHVNVSVFSHDNINECESDGDYCDALSLVKIEQCDSPTLKINAKKKKKIHKTIPKTKRKVWKNNIDLQKFLPIVLTTEQQRTEITNNRLHQSFLDSPYKCETCAKGYAMKISLDRHMNKHNNSGSFVCDLCKMRFSEKSYLRQHFLRHSHKYKCLLCEKILHRVHGMQQHIEISHQADSKPLICSYCGKSSRNKFSLERHMRIHIRPKNYKCTTCTKTFLRVTELNAHMARHSGEKPYKCRYCSLTFLMTVERKSHELVHSPSKNFYCAECDRCFRSKTLLMQHLRRGAKHIKPDLLKFECDRCDKRCRNKRELKLHMDRVHLKLRSQICTVCSATFVTKSALTWHTRTVHEGYKKPKNIICDTCGKGFSSATLLREHVNIHTGKRPYSCTHCGATFAQSGTMHTHIRLVHLKTMKSSERQNSSKRKKSKVCMD